MMVDLRQGMAVLPLCATSHNSRLTLEAVYSETYGRTQSLADGTTRATILQHHEFTQSSRYSKAILMPPSMFVE